MDAACKPHETHVSWYYPSPPMGHASAYKHCIIHKGTNCTKKMMIMTQNFLSILVMKQCCIRWWNLKTLGAEMQMITDRLQWFRSKDTFDYEGAHFNRQTQNARKKLHSNSQSQSGYEPNTFWMLNVCSNWNTKQWQRPQLQWEDNIIVRTWTGTGQAPELGFCVSGNELLTKDMFLSVDSPDCALTAWLSTPVQQHVVCRLHRGIWFKPNWNSHMHSGAWAPQLTIPTISRRFSLVSLIY